MAVIIIREYVHQPNEEALGRTQAVPIKVYSAFLRCSPILFSSQNCLVYWTQNLKTTPYIQKGDLDREAGNTLKGFAKTFATLGA